MEQLKHMKEMLVSCVQGQMTHLESVDAKELGEAIDMIKDLSEAIYYCTITEAMEGKENGQQQMMYYPIMYSPETHEDYYRDMDKSKGRMYYNGGGNNGGGGNSSSRGGASSSSSSTSGGSGTRHYTEREMPWGEAMRDSREGRSPMSRKYYMESKEMHKDKATSMQELEKYVQELTSDMVEMIEGASPEEKQLLSNRIAALATKIK